MGQGGEGIQFFGAKSRGGGGGKVKSWGPRGASGCNSGSNSGPSGSSTPTRGPGTGHAKRWVRPWSASLSGGGGGAKRRSGGTRSEGWGRCSSSTWVPPCKPSCSGGVGRRLGSQECIRSPPPRWKFGRSGEILWPAWGGLGAQEPGYRVKKGSTLALWPSWVRTEITYAQGEGTQHPAGRDAAAHGGDKKRGRTACPAP